MDRAERTSSVQAQTAPAQKHVAARSSAHTGKTNEEDCSMQRRTLVAGALVTLALCLTAPARAAQSEVAEFRVALQYGIGYLPLAIMKHNQLIEKHLKAGG